MMEEKRRGEKNNIYVTLSNIIFSYNFVKSEIAKNLLYINLSPKTLAK